MMVEATDNTSLRERAAAAKAAAEKQAAEKQAVKEMGDRNEATLRLRDALKIAARWLGPQPIPNAPTVEIEGLTFTGGVGRGGVAPFLRVVGTCSRCGEQTVSDAIGGLLDLHEQFERFAPAQHHWDDCHAPSTTAAAPMSPPSAEARLLDALREFVWAEMTAAREE